MRESHPLLLCTRKIESVGRVSAPRLKSSGTIGSHSSPLHLPQVALSSSLVLISPGNHEYRRLSRAVDSNG